MRPSFHLFTALFAFTMLHACTDDSTSGSTPDDASVPNNNPDGGSQTPTGDGQAPGDSAPPPSKVNTTNETVDVDGVSREYVLSVPKTYDAGRSYPLIVALHGDGGDASGFVAFAKLDASTGDDAIIAYPNQSVDLFTLYDQNTDQKLIERVIDAVKQKYSIDASKIWGFGYSKGAYQLNEIACKKPGILSAMAIHAGGAPQPDGNGNINCPAAIGLPVFVTHGENDNPGGGEYCAQYWSGYAGCQSSRSPSTPAICQAYDGCDPGKPVVFCLVPGHPHYPLYGEAAAHSWAWFKTL